jgi:hypothetical protein
VFLLPLVRICNHHPFSSLLICYEVEEPLLNETQDFHANDDRHEILSVSKVLGSPEFRKPLLVICLAMLSQQISGIVTRRPHYYYGLISAIRNQCCPLLQQQHSLQHTSKPGTICFSRDNICQHYHDFPTHLPDRGT